MSFKVEKSNAHTIKGELFLIGHMEDEGHCHCHNSVKSLLSSDIFRKSNPHLVEIFEIADRMMCKNQTGNISHL